MALNRIFNIPKSLYKNILITSSNKKTSSITFINYVGKCINNYQYSICEFLYKLSFSVHNMFMSEAWLLNYLLCDKLHQ